ncbi:hypothetical protein [Terribacillus halophilus]|jgi:hypothetical protein|uniref:hypothetical protein n=1 Tax=Terribacillus halophilus TaxID=361279 RepID=UPI000986CF62|nr:hypothetical protein [Terribacillus halophilus]
MNKLRLSIFGIVFVTMVIVIAIYAYERATDDTYAGMSIIPEEHEDIPLFEGLEPTRSDYEIDGDR